MTNFKKLPKAKLIKCLELHTQLDQKNQVIISSVQELDRLKSPALRDLQQRILEDAGLSFSRVADFVSYLYLGSGSHGQVPRVFD